MKSKLPFYRQEKLNSHQIMEVGQHWNNNTILVVFHGTGSMPNIKLVQVNPLYQNSMDTTET